MPNLSTALVWTALASSLTYWGLRFSTNRSLPIYSPTVESKPAIDSSAVARALGSNGLPVAQTPLAGRFILRGVATGPQGAAAALIAVDGKPAQTFKVGSLVVDQVFLQSASDRQAVLSATLGGPALAMLAMPKLKN